MASPGKPAVFLDRDGTVTTEIGYVNHPERLALLPRSAAAIRALAAAGLECALVTNQAGVARGYFTEEVLHATHRRLEALLAAEGAKLAAIYYCPHHPREGVPPWRADCDCRKPKPGMIERAVRERGYDLARSYMVGDKISDVEFGKKLGARGVMVLTGYGRGEHEFQRAGWTVHPDFLAGDLYDAALWILAREKERAA